MFGWLNKLESKVKSSLEKVVCSQMASSLIRGAKTAIGYEVGYALTHVSDPSNWNQWKSAFVAAAFLGAQKYISWNQQSQS